MLNIIANAFKEIDAEMLERNLAWAVEALIAFKNVEMESGAGVNFFDAHTAKVNKRLEIVGSKAMYAIFEYGNAEYVAEKITKLTNNIIKNRNARIVAKLKKKGIEEIPSFEILWNGSNGDGRFEAGEHTVHIETILAGGYNIQRLHQRTLCHVKPA
tara:strand:+ start:45 stop:515 length:471 start_codon:yes stop_codon:yes gene_type:complete